MLMMCLLKLEIGTQRRFVKAMKEYFSGIVGEIDIRSSAMKPDIENYIALRRESIGVTPGLVFIESVNPKATTAVASDPAETC